MRWFVVQVVRLLFYFNADWSQWAFATHPHFAPHFKKISDFILKWVETVNSFNIILLWIVIHSVFRLQKCRSLYHYSTMNWRKFFHLNSCCSLNECICSVYINQPRQQERTKLPRINTVSLLVSLMAFPIAVSVSKTNYQRFKKKQENTKQQHGWKQQSFYIVNYIKYTILFSTVVEIQFWIGTLSF